MLNDETYVSQVKPHLEFRFFASFSTTPFPWHENETAKNEQDILSGKKEANGKKKKEYTKLFYQKHPQNVCMKCAF